MPYLEKMVVPWIILDFRSLDYSAPFSNDSDSLATCPNYCIFQNVLVILREWYTLGEPVVIKLLLRFSLLTQIKSRMGGILTGSFSIPGFQYEKNQPQNSLNKFKEFYTMKILSFHFFPLIFYMMKLLHDLDILHNRYVVQAHCSAWGGSVLSSHIFQEGRNTQKSAEMW